jgi:hypothetical protein
VFEKPEAIFSTTWMRQTQTCLRVKKLKHSRSRFSIGGAAAVGVGGVCGEGSAAAIGTVVGAATAAIAGVFGFGFGSKEPAMPKARQ